jgi:methylenetetrahydrofolate reductase (NADPH)
MEQVVNMGLHKKAAILPGVMPVRSVKTLLWMKKNVPGVRIDAGLISRMSNARDAQEEGIALAVEMVQKLRNIVGVRGVHIMPSLWESVTPIIIKQSGLLVSD